MSGWSWIFALMGVLFLPFPVLCIADLRHDRDALAYALMGLSVVVAAEPWVIWVIVMGAR